MSAQQNKWNLFAERRKKAAFFSSGFDIYRKVLEKSEKIQKLSGDVDEMTDQSVKTEF